MASVLPALALSATLVLATLDAEAAPAPASADAPALAPVFVADERLPSREWPIAYVGLIDTPGENFDLFDVRFEMTEPSHYSEVPTKSIFGIKRHIGFGGGYDQGIPHASVGFYVTIAEWGRWNFGAPSPAIGFGRYQVYDRRQKKYLRQLQSTILVSLVSLHYRGGYLRSLGKYWYLNIEQIFDSRANLNGSQFGISFANR